MKRGLRRRIAWPRGIDGGVSLKTRNGIDFSMRCRHGAPTRAMPGQAARVRHRRKAFGRSAYVTGRSRPSSVAYLACVAAFTAALPLAATPQTSAIARRAAVKLPVPLVYLRDVDATIAQDIKYATTDNFTGARVDGYEAGECILTRQVAEALGR